MGAQGHDEAEARYDPRAGEDEYPVHDVELNPFFLARHEMTQGQWALPGSSSATTRPVPPSRAREGRCAALRG